LGYCASKRLADKGGLGYALFTFLKSHLLTTDDQKIVTLEEKKDLVFFFPVVHQKSFQSILVDPGLCSKADKADR